MLEEGNELEQLFLESAASGDLIQITLKNYKVYIGFTDYISPPSKTNYFILTPVLSGYRESETKKFVITTNYQEVYREYYAESDAEELNPEVNEEDESVVEFPDIDIVIKQDEIITASFFDADLYSKFNPTTIIPFNNETSNSETLEGDN
ncbi:hypothetical protein GTQ38_13445 [Flavobacteriaceae bacterium R33]|uniref:Uncharacterized protein n=1 Tax=Poritiphilus flavus TaxID=2697053 RepID=A0A6L9EE25_9FLAO|nr:hypothetical protein [Poritiphilus flavus]